MIYNSEIIGFGSAACGYSANQKPVKSAARGRIYNALKRRYNKYLLKPRMENAYVHSVETAIKLGFRWIDYSCAYGDGVLLGKAIKDSGISREQLIITTRISNRAQVEHQVIEELQQFLQNSELGYVDILQFH